MKENILSDYSGANLSSPDQTIVVQIRVPLRLRLGGSITKEAADGGCYGNESVVAMVITSVVGCAGLADE